MNSDLRTKRDPNLCLAPKAANVEHRIQCLHRTFGFDHINRNAPVLIRTPKLTRFEPAQYWGGGPPGNSVVLNPFLPWFFLSFWCKFVFSYNFLIVFWLRFQQALALFHRAFDVCEVVFRVFLVNLLLQTKTKGTNKSQQNRRWRMNSD